MSQSLSRVRFVGRVGELIADLDWRRVVPLYGPGVHALAKCEGHVVRVLLIEFSRRYSERVTASLAIGQTAGWAGGRVTPTGISASGERVGDLIDASERPLFGVLDAPPLDAWWSGLTVENAAHLAAAIRIAEPRFYTPALASAALAEPRFRQARADAEAVATMAEGLREQPEDLVAQPARPDPEIPPAFLWAAELRLREVAQAPIDAFDRASVRFLAADGWELSRMPGGCGN